jgi:CheY-like chemotaxis protein
MPIPFLSALKGRSRRAADPPPTDPGPYGGTETILLVEDEPAIRGLLVAALTRAGYRVLEARNGAEAIGVFDAESGAVDLLLTDVNMPYVSGTTLADELCGRRPSLKRLYISGYLENANLTGGAPFLAKPFVRDDLLKAVRGVLDGQTIE